jgi:hypothetical protein
VKVGYCRGGADLLFHDEVPGDLFTQARVTLDLLVTKYSKAYGVDVRTAAAENTDKIWLIDWDDPEANDFFLQDRSSTTRCRSCWPRSSPI